MDLKVLDVTLGSDVGPAWYDGWLAGSPKSRRLPWLEAESRPSYATMIKSRGEALR